MAPWFGFVPAPRYATETPAETLAADVMRAQLPKQARTKAQMEHARQVSELVRDVRTGKVANEQQFRDAALAAGVKDSAEVTRIGKRVMFTPLQNSVAAMPLDQAMRVWDVASEEERMALVPMIAQRIQKKWDAGELEPEKARRYVQMTTPYYQKLWLNLR